MAAKIRKSLATGGAAEPEKEEKDKEKEYMDNVVMAAFLPCCRCLVKLWRQV